MDGIRKQCAHASSSEITRIKLGQVQFFLVMEKWIRVEMVKMVALLLLLVLPIVFGSPCFSEWRPTEQDFDLKLRIKFWKLIKIKVVVAVVGGKDVNFTCPHEYLRVIGMGNSNIHLLNRVKAGIIIPIPEGYSIWNYQITLNKNCLSRVLFIEILSNLCQNWGNEMALATLRSSKIHYNLLMQFCFRTLYLFKNEGCTNKFFFKES